MFRPVSLLATPIAPTAMIRYSGFLRIPLGFGGCYIAFALDLSPTPIERFMIPATLGQPHPIQTQPHVRLTLLGRLQAKYEAIHKRP